MYSCPKEFTVTVVPLYIAVYTNPSAFDFRHHLKHFIKPLGVMDCPIVLLLVASLRPVKAPLYVAQSVAGLRKGLLLLARGQSSRISF